jgi:branched-chain amino acid transport system substrate-binding protein
MKTRVFFSTLLVFAILTSCKTESNKQIEIASIQQLTGQMSKYGKTLQAALLAEVDIINEERINNNLPLINITFEDDKLDTKTGISSLQQLIQTKKIQICFGAQSSSVTLAMAPIANQSKVVLISSASGAPEISQSGDYVFRTCPSDVYEASICADYYNANLSDKSLAIIHTNNDYGVGLKESFLKNINNPEKVGVFPFQQGQSDFKTILSKIKQQKTDAVYLIGYEEMITVFRQATELGLTCQWLGNNQMNDPDMVRKFEKTANGTIFPGHQYDLNTIKAEHVDFYTKYLGYSNGVDLDVFAAYGVDALIAVNQALLNGANTGEEIKNELYKMKKIQGFTGVFSFDENGDPIKTVNLYKIENGEIVEL